MSNDARAGEHYLLTDTGRRVPSSYKWAVVAMLWTITFFNYADRMALSANMPLIRDEFGLDKATGGMLGSAFGYSYGLCAIFAGFIVDRVRRKNAVLLGLCVWSLICTGTALAHNFWILFAFLALEGLGEAFYFPAAMSLLSDYHGKRTRSRAMSINQTSVYFGTIGGTFLAGKLALKFDTWRAPFVVFGVLGVVLAVVLWRFLYEPKRGAADLADAGEDTPESPEPLEKEAVPTTPFLNNTAIAALLMAVAGIAGLIYSALHHPADASALTTIGTFAPYAVLTVLGLVLLLLRSLRKDAEFWTFFRVFFTTPSAVLLLLAFLCANSVAIILLVWMPSFVVERIYGNDMAMLAVAGLLATTPLQISSMVGSPTGGILADFFRARTLRGRVLVQGIGVVCAVPFVILCGNAHAYGTLIAALIGWGLFKGMYDSNIFASVYDVMPKELRGMTAGFMNMFGWAGGALAPILAGKIADNKELGLGYAISHASVGYLACGLLLFAAAMIFVKRDAARVQKIAEAAE